MEREALKLALEALELHLTHHEHGCVYLDPAVTAIKAALAQPAHSEWNAALDEAASRINEIIAFPKTTQDSFAVFIQGLKR